MPLPRVPQLDDLAVLAGRRALENAGVKAEELDYILCATLGGEYITPPLACYGINASYGTSATSSRAIQPVGRARSATAGTKALPIA